MVKIKIPKTSQNYDVKKKTEQPNNLGPPLDHTSHVDIQPYGSIWLMLSAALPSGGGFDIMGSAMVAMAMTDSSAEEVRSLVTARPSSNSLPRQFHSQVVTMIQIAIKGALR